MRIIHCADLHIGSAMHGVANPTKRRAELIDSFASMVDYAYDNDIEAVLIAGDLIDSDSVTNSEIASIASILNKYSNIGYYIVEGNHASHMPYQRLRTQLGNSSHVHFFGEQWTGYDIDNVSIWGIELDQHSTSSVYSQLATDKDRFNIAILHADTDDDRYGNIDTTQLLSKCQYTALGHRHSYMVADKKGNNVVVYSGVLEPRGFDELDQSGWVVLDTNTGKHQHIAHSMRSVVSVTLDISSATSDIELLDMVKNINIAPRNYLNLTLVGVVSDDIVIDRVKEALKEQYFALRLVNNTTANIDIEALQHEQSLRGRVVDNICKLSAQQLVARGILPTKHNAEDIANAKRDMIHTALQALAGEAVSW